MKFQVPHSPRGLLGSGAGNWQARLAKKRKKRNLQESRSSSTRRLSYYLHTSYDDAQQSSNNNTNNNNIQVLSSSSYMNMILLSSLLLIAILLLPTATCLIAERAQPPATGSHPKRFRGQMRDSFSAESSQLANSSSLSWTKDKHNEVLRRLSLNGPSLLEALIKHPIQSNLPFPMLPTVTRRMPPPYSLNIPQTTANRERRLNQLKQTSNNTNNNRSSRPLLKVGGGLINVEHLVERLEENKKRLASVSKLEPTTAGNKRKPQEDHIDEPILPSDLESVKHQGLTLNMLIREEYDLRVKPMLKSLLDQQRIATASSVQLPTSTTTGAQNSSTATTMSINNNHRHEVSSSTNLFSTTLSPTTEEQLGDHATRILFADKSDAILTTPLPGQLMTPSMLDVRDLFVTYENMEDRSDKISEIEFDDRRFEDSRSRKRVKATTGNNTMSPKSVKKIIPPYQFGAAQFERPRVSVNVATGSQTAASSSSPKSVNGYVEQYKYPTTRSAAASNAEVSNADATTRLGSMVFSDGAHEAERVKNLRQRTHLLDSSRSPAQRKKMSSTSSSPLDAEDVEDNDEDNDDDEDPNEADNNKKQRVRHNMIPNHHDGPMPVSTISPLEKLESQFKRHNSSSGDPVFRLRDRKLAGSDQFIIGSGADWSRPVGSGRFAGANYATTMANLLPATTTSAPSTHPDSPVLLSPNSNLIKHGQQQPLPTTLTLPQDNSVLLPVSTPRYSFQLHEKPKKNATLYSIPNLSISEVINLRPGRVRDAEPAAKKAQAQDNLVGPLWSPSKIGHPQAGVDSTSETQQVYRKKQSQPASSLQPNTRTVNSSSSYPMLVSVVGTKGMVVSGGGNHSRPPPYSTPDYGQTTTTQLSGDTESEPMLRATTSTTTTMKPGRILRGSFFGDQHLESGHDLALRNESGTVYTTRFHQVDLEPAAKSGLPRGAGSTANLTDKHDSPPSGYWPASLLPPVSRRRPGGSNSTHRRPAAGLAPLEAAMEDAAELSEYARADEADEPEDTSAEDHSLEPAPPSLASSEHPRLMNGSWSWPQQQAGAAAGPRRRIIKDRVSSTTGANAVSQQVVPALEFIRKFKPYTQSKGFNPDSHEQAGSEIQMTEIDKAIQQQQQPDKKPAVPPLFKLAGPRETSSEPPLEGGTLSSSSSSSSSSSNGQSQLPASATGVSGEKVNEQHTGKGSENLSTSATASAPVTKLGGSTKQQQADTRASTTAAGKQSNDRLAFILIGGSCALSVVCLVLAAMSMRCQDMCDDYRSLRNAERAAMKLQKHRLKYTKSHQINRLNGGAGHGAASIDDLPDNLSLNHHHGVLEAADISAASRNGAAATSNKCLAANLSSAAVGQHHLAAKTTTNMNIWAPSSEPEAGNKESPVCRCANCSRWLPVCLEPHEKPHWQSHYCLQQSHQAHQQQHPTRVRPLFGAGSSVGTFYPRRAEDHHSAISGAAFTDAQMLIDSQPAHSCSLSDALLLPRAAKQHHNSSQKTYPKQHYCGELAANLMAAASSCNNPDHHGHAHLCHNNHANTRYNMETSASDGGKLTLDESIHACDGLAKCHHGASLSKRIKLMQLRSNLHSSHTSTGWKHSDAAKASSKYHQPHHHHQHHHHNQPQPQHHQHQHQHQHHQLQRQSKQHVHHQSSSDSSSVDQCTCLHDNQPLLSKSHGRQVDRASHKHLMQQHSTSKLEARHHKTKRDKAMLVWSTNRDRLI